MTNGSLIPRGGQTMEASRIFLNDTCLTEFDQGWVRGSQSPSGSKNWQREATSQIISWLILFAYIYIWIPHPRDPEAGILYFAENCCWFEIEISTLGDLCFVGGEEGIPLLGGRCWIGTHLVVSPLGLSYHINKTIWVSPTCCVSMMFCYICMFSLIWS